MSVRVRVAGRGRPLVLIHGLGVSAASWAPLEAHLPGFEMISFDPPGIGESPGSWRRPTMGGLARVLSRLLEILERPKVDVLGLSWGGLLAQQFAHDHPGQVNRLVLCGTACGLGSVPGDPRALMAMMTPIRSRWVANLLYGRGAVTHAAAFNDFLRLRGRPSTAGYYGQIARVTGWTSLPWLGRVRARTLVMAGRRDNVVPPINARILAWRLPDARLHWVDDGHLFLMLQPAKCGAVISDFLTEGT